MIQKSLKTYKSFSAGDIYLGRVNDVAIQEHLHRKKVIVRPSVLAQQVSHSKCNQTDMFKAFMIPCTSSCRTGAELRSAVQRIHHAGYRALVTKTDTGGCGVGVKKWTDMDVCCESLFPAISQQTPYIVQPFISSYTDIRVIMVGDTIIDTYARSNDHDFRCNLSCGGNATPYELSESDHKLCSKIMKTGQFHYAHLDLMKTEDSTFLTELSLSGGSAGSVFSATELVGMKRGFIQDEFIPFADWEHTGFKANH